MNDDVCAFEDCGRPVHPRSAWCSGHVWQRQHGREMTPLRPRKQRPWEMLLSAALAISDVDASDSAAWERACARLRMAAARYRRTNSSKSPTLPESPSHPETRG